ncbi:carboxypeptidase-like regulatory domain-containing protein [Puteibacter caeruleilacunae]|nr:carboxypeptidase-like regulatory domain-containing protein [Puteibacter caeruleilacunae]
MKRIRVKVFFSVLYVLFLLCSGFQNTTAYGQVFKGKIVDESTTESLKYVNVTVPSLQVGTMSDKNGKFKLDISKVRLNDTIKISHLGYKTVKLSLKDLKALESRIVALKQKVYLLNEIVAVSEGSKSKMIGSLKYNKRKPQKFGLLDISSGYEFGVCIANNSPVKIRAVNFLLSKCTYNDLLVRMNFYAVEQDPEKDNTYDQKSKDKKPGAEYIPTDQDLHKLKLKNIASQPIYMKLSKEELEGGEVHFDVAQYNLTCEGSLLIALEFVEDMSEGTFGIWARNSGQVFYRSVGQENWASFGMSLCLNAEVVKLKK